MKLTYYDFAKAVLPDDRIKGVFEPREYPGVDRNASSGAKLIKRCKIAILWIGWSRIKEC